MDKVLLSSKKMDWETPQSLFDELNRKFKFDLDACANDQNHKLPNYFTEKDDALVQEWEGNVFINPPYGRMIGKFVQKAYQESLRQTDRFIVMLIPARTDTTYWQDYVQGKAVVKFLRGRLKFEVNGVRSDAAPFPSVLVSYGI